MADTMNKSQERSVSDMESSNEPQFAIINNLFIDRVFESFDYYNITGRRESYWILERGIPHRKGDLVMFHPLVDNFYSGVSESWWEDDPELNFLMPFASEFQTKKPYTIDKSREREKNPIPREYDFDKRDKLAIIREPTWNKMADYEIKPFPDTYRFRLIPLRQKEFQTVSGTNLDDINNEYNRLELSSGKLIHGNTEINEAEEELPWLEKFAMLTENNFLNISDIPVEVFHRYGEFPMQELEDRPLYVKNNKTSKNYHKRKYPKNSTTPKSIRYKW